MTSNLRTVNDREVTRLRAIDLIGSGCSQASLVCRAEGLELEDQQAAQRGNATFLATFLAAFRVSLLSGLSDDRTLWSEYRPTPRTKWALHVLRRLHNNPHACTFIRRDLAMNVQPCGAPRPPERPQA